LVLLFTISFGQEHPSGDRWFGVDKTKHFFTAALVQSVSFSGLRVAGVSRSGSLIGATAVAGAVSVGKELIDKRGSGTPSFKDLAWDGAGMAVAGVMLSRTER